jgi:Ca2+/Na+ antiporter
MTWRRPALDICASRPHYPPAMQFMFVAESNKMSAPTVLMLLGSAALYVASRAAVDSLAHFKNAGGAGRLPSPGLLALGHWVPIVALAGLATARGLSHAALGVVFGSSVAALSLAMGLVTYLAPPTSLPPTRRAWPLLICAVIVPLLAGFTGELTGLHALVLIVLGAMAWSVWHGAKGEFSSAEALAAALPLTAPGAGRASFAARSTLKLRTVQWLLAVALAFLGAKLSLWGAVGAESRSRFLSTGLLAGALLSPLAVLPMIASGTDLAHQGRSGDAVAALVGLAMLNLFALLPMVIVFWYLRSAGQIGFQTKMSEIWAQLEPIPLPMAVWRIDLVVLAIISFAMVPVALGRWALGRLESVGLIIGYVAYLVASLRLHLEMRL